MKKTMPVWNLKLLYASPTDPRLEKDTAAFEKVVDDFSKKYDTPKKSYLSDPADLLQALTDYEKGIREAEKKFGVYLYFLRDIEASNAEASAGISRLESRMAKVENKAAFFSISLGQIAPADQKWFLADPRLAHFRVFLSRVFSDAKFKLSIPEEKIMNLKSIPAYNMWVSGNERVLNMKTVPWKKKALPVSEALNMVQQLPTAAERAKLASALAETLKAVAPFSESEMNAIVTNKKINDELRGYATAYENTVRGYRNDPKVVDRLVETVTDNFGISHRFHRVKARLLGLKKLSYSDRAAKIGTVKTKFTFDASAAILKKTFNALDPRFGEILDAFIREGRIDARPRVGKTGGAYCAGSYSCPTFVLLNHVDDLHSFTTFAHEFGHAFHTEFSRSQGALYCGYSTALAETASTLFEAIALDAVYDSLPEKEKAIVLHDKINDDIATIFRQIACFNYEKDIHAGVRSKGYLPASELAELHNKNMAAYLGPMFRMKPDDGYYFVHWGHLRRFFYVYTYAYGQLVSKALLRRYRKDSSFWKKIEQFLSAGGKASPEEILREIGIDPAKPGFWEEGLKEIESDIEKLEELAGK